MSKVNVLFPAWAWLRSKEEARYRSRTEGNALSLHTFVRFCLESISSIRRKVAALRSLSLSLFRKNCTVTVPLNANRRCVCKNAKIRAPASPKSLRFVPFLIHCRYSRKNSTLLAFIQHYRMSP